MSVESLERHPSKKSFKYTGKYGEIELTDPRYQMLAKNALEEARSAIISHPNVIGDRIHMVVLADGRTSSDFAKPLTSDDLHRTGLDIVNGVHLIQQSPIPSDSDNFTRFYLWYHAEEKDTEENSWEVSKEIEWRIVPGLQYLVLPKKKLLVRGHQQKTKLPFQRGREPDVVTPRGRSEIESFEDLLEWRNEILDNLHAPR